MVLPNHKPKNLNIIAKINYPGRIIGSLILGLIIGSVMIEGDFFFLWFFALFHALLWSHLAYWLCKISKDSKKQEYRNLLIDSAFYGFWVPIFSFSIIPSICGIIAGCMGNAHSGGYKFLLKGLVFNALGVLIGISLLGRINVTFESSIFVTIVSALSLLSYCSFVGVVGNNQTNFLIKIQKKLKWAHQQREEALSLAAEAKKLALVGQVAGKMAHDFNNILGIIMGNTELTLLDCQEPETRKTLELIFEQTIRGKNLTKNLVAFARDQEPKQEFFRISGKIDFVLNLMRKDLEGVELRKEESPGVPELLADPGMIEHALANLLQNSIHATSMNESPRIIIRTYSLDNKICYEIEDNGCGIPKENLENIYEPSFTLKGSKDVTGSYKRGIKGTGYGMANVKKYVEQHKGSISIESEVGVGATVTICLPIIKKELTAKEKSELKKEITQFEKYILLVVSAITIIHGHLFMIN